ncbi:haloacid dehalogenase-like hydrolase [Streptomyces sp. A7024]|uniref:phosphoserine phosphatase n=1 Tax=Streptomyces coryli TaxID=1128680 RepID=A0A6G4TWG5_9ACTN|nr:HAD family hydrolase [Streptomyces coryli]NGN64325.1 haloacid dehalogenase-like hydrolase [Streptomyces coryli]
MTSPVLPSWREGPARTAILRFVAEVTTPDGDHYLEPPDRIAVFDNDGTLWPERPMPVQLHFLTERWREMAAADPSLADRQPYASAVSGDPTWIASVVDDHYAGDDTRVPALAEAIMATQQDMDTDTLAERVAEFFANARHPVLKRPYPACAYQPMLELLGFLRESGFTTAIVSGGGRDFMRVVSADMYGVPPELVIGSTAETSWSSSREAVVYGASIGVLDDGPQKPVLIWDRLGRRPVLACGNSNGDIEMLTHAAAAPRGLALLVRHDDDTRDDPPYDGGAERALAEAGRRGWVTVSVRDDWSCLYPDAT